MAYQWYAIQTYSGSELAVKRAIEQLVVDYGIEEKVERIVVPTEDENFHKPSRFGWL